MKQTTVEFSFEDEKLEAIKIFLNDKNTTLTDKLVSFMESLYNDYVPEDVRSYIGDLARISFGQTIAVTSLTK